jgi:hypothetical protein
MINIIVLFHLHHVILELLFMFTSVDEISVKHCLSVGYVQSNLVYQLVFTVKPCLSISFYSQTLFISWFLQSNLVYQLVFTVTVKTN